MKKSIFRIALIATIVASMMLLGTMTAFAATEVTSAEDFDAAGDYVLGDDITGNVTLSEGTYTIDLAGYEWKGNLTIQGADVTITDSDAGKFGLMASDDNDVIIIESGKLTTTEITSLSSEAIRPNLPASESVIVTSAPWIVRFPFHS